MILRAVYDTQDLSAKQPEIRVSRESRFRRVKLLLVIRTLLSKVAWQTRGGGLVKDKR